MLCYCFGETTLHFSVMLTYHCG